MMYSWSRKVLCAALASTICIGAAPSKPRSPITWSLDEKNDAMTDAASVNLVGMVGDNGLIVGCAAGKSDNPSIGILTTSFLGSYPVARQTMIRFDQRTPDTRWWGYADHFAFDSASNEQFVEQMKTARSVTIRLKKYDDVPLDLTFPLAGAIPQLAKLRAACAKIGATW